MKKDNAPESSASENPKKSREFFEVRIPRFSFKDTSTNVYLVFVLVVFAFLLGMLTNKVMYLEKVSKSNTANVSAQAGQAVNPTQPPPPPQVVDVAVGKLPILGNANAKVTIVEFSDFQCPFCKRYFDDAGKQVQEKYINTGKAKLAYRHYPLTTIHPNAQKAAEASECANEQGKFWEYHDLLFGQQETWSPQSATDVLTSFTDLSGQAGLDTTKFRACLDSQKYKKNVDDDAAAGTTAQVDGTPAFFVNGNRITGAQPFSEFQKVIEQELKK